MDGKSRGAEAVRTSIAAAAAEDNTYVLYKIENIGLLPEAQVRGAERGGAAAAGRGCAVGAERGSKDRAMSRIGHRGGRPAVSVAAAAPARVRCCNAAWEILARRRRVPRPPRVQGARRRRPPRRPGGSAGGLD